LTLNRLDAVRQRAKTLRESSAAVKAERLRQMEIRERKVAQLKSLAKQLVNVLAEFSWVELRSPNGLHEGQFQLGRSSDDLTVQLFCGSLMMVAYTATEIADRLLFVRGGEGARLTLEEAAEDAAKLIEEWAEGLRPSVERENT
jgi:hypothetical protein